MCPLQVSFFTQPLQCSYLIARLGLGAGSTRARLVIHGVICLWIVLLIGSLLNINYLHDTVVGARGLIKSHKMSLPSKTVKSCLEAKLLCVERDQYLRADAKCGRIELSLISPPGF